MRLENIEKANNHADRLKAAEVALISFSGLHKDRKTIVNVMSNQESFTIECSKEALVNLAKSSIENSVKALELCGVSMDVTQK